LEKTRSQEIDAGLQVFPATLSQEKRKLKKSRPRSVPLAEASMSSSALLPVESQRELNDPWFVRLTGQVLQSGSGVGIDVVGMVECVEEIGRESNVGNFFEFEVLEY
jgi:hypothetical protein